MKSTVRFLRLSLLLLALARPAGARAAGATGAVIFDMDTIRHRPGEVTNPQKQKVPIGTVELVAGQTGQAVQFTFTGGLGAGFMTAPVQATPEWNQAGGFSFCVKGDGSTNWAGLELIDRSDYSLRYGYCFPIESREWRKITVAWEDLTPELAGPLVDPAHGYAPAGFGNFWFGKWFYWREYPAHSFAIDQVVLERNIVPPPPSPEAGAGLQRLRAKLRAGQPVTVVTMGDSLTDLRHWANRETPWPERLARQLKARHGGEVTLVNPALGGTTLSQNLILLPRWLRDHPAPDLVTIWFGYNDWDSGVRGPRFQEYLRLAVDRLRRQTQGHADILLLTTSPAFARWDTMKEMEQAAREVAGALHTGLADVAAEFRRCGSADEAMKMGLWAWDKTHLGPQGHALAAETVLRAIEDGGGAKR